jgi:hypothetical protein
MGEQDTMSGDWEDRFGGPWPSGRSIEPPDEQPEPAEETGDEPTGDEVATPEEIAGRLEYLRGQLRAECISWGELHELQGLAEHIQPGDVELLEPAGVPEFPPDEGTEDEPTMDTPIS